MKQSKSPLVLAIILGMCGGVFGYFLLGGVFGTLLCLPIGLATMVSLRTILAPKLENTSFEGTSCQICGSHQTEDLGDMTSCNSCGHIG